MTNEKAIEVFEKAFNLKIEKYRGSYQVHGIDICPDEVIETVKTFSGEEDVMKTKWYMTVEDVIPSGRHLEPDDYNSVQLAVCDSLADALIEAMKFDIQWQADYALENAEVAEEIKEAQDELEDGCPNCASAETGGNPNFDPSTCVLCKGTGVPKSLSAS